MASTRDLSEAIEKIAGELNGFIAASFVDVDSGLTLAVRSTRPEFDLDAASAFNSEMVKQKQKTIRVLKLSSKLEDMLLTLSDQIHLIKMISDSTFLYLAAEKAATNLAIVRSTVGRHTQGIEA